GTISVLSGGSIECDGSFVNQGAISLDGGTIYFRSDWSNTGSISAINSTLILQGTYSTASLPNIIRNGGQVSVGGTLNNSGGTLNIDSIGTWSFDTGQVNGGTIKAPPGIVPLVSGFATRFIDRSEER